MEIYGLLWYINKYKRTAFVKVRVFLYLIFICVVVKHRFHKAVKDNEGSQRNYLGLVAVLIMQVSYFKVNNSLLECLQS